MKLFQTYDNEWAAKMHLIDDMDLDLSVAFYSNKTLVKITITDHRCPEGMILSHQLDGETVQLLSGDIAYWSGVIHNGQLKLQARLPVVPQQIRFLDIKTNIPITYE